MQLTPSQFGMSLMIHGCLPMGAYDSRSEGIARGRQQLMKITKQDFGYDLRAWHSHLITTNTGGYKWRNGHRSYAKEIEIAITDSDWRLSVATAESESLLERLTESDLRSRNAVEQGEREWAGKPRNCPDCETQFTSVRDRGQCPSCGHIFYASHPDLGNVMWWLQV